MVSYKFDMNNKFTSKFNLKNVLGFMMKYKLFHLFFAVNIILLASCKDESGLLSITSNTFFVQENETNHFKLEIYSSRSVLQYNDNLNFVNDKVILKLQITGYSEGSGNIYLYDNNNIEITDVFFNRDMEITDTLITVQPKKILISFKDFTGLFNFQLK